MDKDNENEAYRQISPNIDGDQFIKKPEEIVGNLNIPIKELYESAVHDYTRSYEAPETILEVNGQIWGTLGNFSIISGKTKSKKKSPP